MKTGTVKKLVHLSGQTDIPFANVVSSHNYHGYGYIASDEVNDDDKEVYFEHSVVADRRFDELSEGSRVEFELENSKFHRATSVSIAQRAGSPR